MPGRRKEMLNVNATLPDVQVISGYLSIKIVSKALESPVRQIVENADPSSDTGVLLFSRGI